MPTGNSFLKDPQKRSKRPDTNPGDDVPYVAAGYNDASWQKVNLPHDYAIEGPFTAAVTCTLASVLCGTLSLVLSGQQAWGNVLLTGWVWWLGNAMGALVMGSAVMLLAFLLAGFSVTAVLSFWASAALVIREHLMPENWYEEEYFKAKRQRLEGTSAPPIS